MSAIIGVFQKNAHVEKSVLYSMQCLLSHRGQYKSSQYIFNVATTSNSLWNYGGIACNTNKINLDASLIPLWNDTHDIAIMLDGEIYNADELSNILKANGVICRNITSEEVVLQLFLLYGIDETLKLLDGAYSIAIYDKRVEKFYLVRDRLGEKPIYYYYTTNLFLFASEYKAFYCHPEFKAILNIDGFAEYLMFNFPIGETTLLKNVFLVEPGTYMVISSSEIQTITYWDIPVSKSNNNSLEENKQLLSSLIRKSIKRRIKNTSSIGVQLSGGVDSSYVAAIAKKEGANNLIGYAITFDNQIVSEEKYIDFVATKINIPTQKIQFDAKDFYNRLKDTIWHCEAPMHFTGNVPLYELNNKASNDIQIILSGDGADECIGGYRPIYRAVHYHKYKKGLIWRCVQFKNILKGKKHYSSLHEWFIAEHQDLTDEQARCLIPNYHKDYLHHSYQVRRALMKKYCSSDFTHQILCYEIRSYMLDTLLRGDKLSMASSLDLHAPLLMTELVEFLQTVPEEQLVDVSSDAMRGTKVLLKNLCADEYGDSFAYRQKLGLDMPMHEFWSYSDMRNWVEASLLPKLKEREIINYDYFVSIWSEIPNLDTCYSPHLSLVWKVLNFEIWAQQYLDDSPVNYSKNNVSYE